MKRFIKRRLPVPETMDSAEREYYRNLRKYAEKYIGLVRAGLDEIIPGLKEQAGEELPRADAWRMDANIDKTVRKLFLSVQDQLTSLFPDSLLARWAVAMAGLVNTKARSNMKKAAKVADVEIEPLMRDRELTPYFKNIVENNVGLIRTIPTERLPAFQNQLIAMITQDQTQDTIRKMITRHFGLCRARARIIARDQVNKLNGRLAQYRQQQIGGKRYIWRTAKDERVRDDHKKLEGKICSWDNPPIVDRSTGRREHPAQDFQCRCWAEMVLDDVLE